MKTMSLMFAALWALVAPEARAQSIGGSFTVPGADVEWMAATVASAPTTGQTGELILTAHVEESFTSTYNEICLHLSGGQTGANVTFVLYSLPLGGAPTNLLWSSDPVDASASGRKCALLGDDGGTITTAGIPYFNSADELELSLLDSTIGQVAKGRVKIGSGGTQVPLNERVLGSGQRNIGFGQPTPPTTVVPSYRGWTQTTVTPPAVFAGSASISIDAPYLPLVR